MCCIKVSQYNRLLLTVAEDSKTQIVRKTNGVILQYAIMYLHGGMQIAQAHGDDKRMPSIMYQEASRSCIWVLFAHATAVV